MTAVDIFGPASSLNSVTARPSDGRAFTAADTFFKDCTTPSAQDGTQVVSGWLNQVTGVLRSLARANGLKRDGINPVVAYDQSDAMVLNGIAQLIQRGQLNYAVDQGAVNALSVVPTITPAELIDGLPLVVKVGTTNTAPATITLTGFSTVPVPIVKFDGSALAAGDLLAGAFASLRYDIAAGKFRATGLLKSDGIANLSVSASVTLAQTLITNYPSISPPRQITSFLAAGTYTFTVPANVTWILATVVGAGGGGAGGGAGATWSGGGGASGGTTIAWIAVTPGQIFTVVVGGGGAGSSNGNGATANGGASSSFGSGLMATGGGGATGGTATCAGGGAGVGSGGQINLPGSSGGDGNPLDANVQGGQGGASSQGGGGRTSTIQGSGSNGQAPGSGGGGIWQSGGSNPQTGGHGADGAVFIQY